MLTNFELHSRCQFNKLIHTDIIEVKHLITFNHFCKCINNDFGKESALKSRQHNSI